MERSQDKRSGRQLTYSHNQKHPDAYADANGCGFRASAGGLRTGWCHKHAAVMQQGWGRGHRHWGGAWRSSRLRTIRRRHRRWRY